VLGLLHLGSFSGEHYCHVVLLLLLLLLLLTCWSAL
jgi:hypothetical protein